MADPEIIGTRPPSLVFRGDRIRYRTGATGYLASDGWNFGLAFIANDDPDETGSVRTILLSTDVTPSIAEYQPGIWEIDHDSSGGGVPSTRAWQAGLFYWTEFVEKGSFVDRVTLRRGSMRVEKSFDEAALSSGADFRSWARTSLDNVRAVLQKKAGLDQLSYAIAGRSLQRYTTAELLDLEKYLSAIVAREDRDEAAALDGLTDAGLNLVEF